uniref:Uncharacterized protein n=1 Tax=Rhizophora mucronata TaxID=61149 RepID=A0A2P2IWY3_RHIMU
MNIKLLRYNTSTSSFALIP